MIKRTTPWLLLVCAISTGEEAPPCATATELAELSGAIAFESEVAPGNMELFVMEPPDWTPRQLTDHPAFDGHPSWSPDGERILFTSIRTGNKDMFLMNKDGTNVVQISDDPDDEDYHHWHPDGDWIAYTFHGQIWQMKPDGSEEAPLVDRGRNEAPRWSPDGSRLLFTRSVMNPKKLDYDYEIYVRDMRTGEETQLTHTGGTAAMGRWSPDGTRVAFAARPEGTFNSYVIDADGSNVRKITTKPGHDWMAGWSPDGRKLLVPSELGGTWDIYVINIEDGARLRITCTEFATRAPDWWHPTRK